MRFGLVTSLLACALWIGAAYAEPGGKRVALVIGNSDYLSVPHLDNPGNDAKGIAQQLRDLGFDVTLALNLDKSTFEQRVREFAESLNGAEAAVFYYAGHGLKVDGRNYMVPVDANVANEADLPFQLVAVDIALQRLAGQRTTNIVILDACRNNPLSKELAHAIGDRADAVGQGLAGLYAGVGTLISLSTQPNTPALDGEGDHSPYTEALIAHIGEPNVDVVSMLQDVRRDVAKKTDNSQVPWDESSLIEKFFFNPTKDRARPAQDKDATSPIGPVAHNDNTSDADRQPKEADIDKQIAPKPEADNQVKPQPDTDTSKGDVKLKDGEPDLSHILPPSNNASKVDGADKDRQKSAADTSGSDDQPDLSHVLPPDTSHVLPPSSDEVVVNGRPPVTPCDTIAASATDPERVVHGGVMGDLDGPAGVKACREAIAKYPNTPRFEFQLARSLQKSESYSEAAKFYADLVRQGYFAALVNYGWLLNNGQGVQRDQKESVRLYLIAAAQGDKLGMFNVAMAYDSGEGLPLNPSQAANWIYAALRFGHDYSLKQMSGPATGWTPEFRKALQRLLKQAGAYSGPINGVFGPEVWSAVREVQTLPFAPSPGGQVPDKRWDPTSIPVNSPLPQ